MVYCLKQENVSLERFSLFLLLIHRCGNGGNRLNAVGIIVEYNPFHNGHLYHLEKTKEITNADVVIAVMSGFFLQRGEPALLSKWHRAKMALLAGVDIVFELPYPFCTQKADTFAYGAVSLLAAARCKAICFGSESGNIEAFHDTYDFLQKNDEVYQERIKFHMYKGVSYPKAASLAFEDLSPTKEMIDLTKPNNILGFQYVKSIRDLKLPMKAYTVTRTNAQYHDTTFSSSSIASATSIRHAIFSEEGHLEKVKPYVPLTSYEIMQNYEKEYASFHQWENYWPYLKFRLLHSTRDELKEIYEVEEGIENRLISIAREADTFFRFMTMLKTKRYPWTRLQRMCVHILTNTKVSEMKERMAKPTYLRLLGMSEKGRQYLNRWKKHFSLPVISKLSSYDKEDINLDLRSAQIYALGANRNNQNTLLNLEYKQPPIYIKNR